MYAEIIRIRLDGKVEAEKKKHAAGNPGKI